LLILIYTIAAVVAFSGIEPLCAQPKADQVRDKTVAEADKLSDVARAAIEKDVEELEETGNWWPLVVKLKDGTPEVRSLAAGALKEALGHVKSKEDVKQIIPPLVAAMLNDPSAKVRDLARSALRDLVSRVEDEKILESVVRSYLAGLKHGGPKVRAHCAQDVSRVVSRIEDQTTLAGLAGPLAAATLKSSSTNAPDFPGFAMRSVLRRIKDPKALTPVMQFLIGGLEHKDPTIRGFAIHALSEGVVQIKDKGVLRSMIDPLNVATGKAASTGDRDFAGLVLRSVLRKTDDEAATIPVIHSSLAGLEHKNRSMRTFYAHTLHENVRKIKDKALLTRTVRPLTTASLRAEDSKTPGLGAADLAYSALKQVLDRVDDQAVLVSIVSPMAEALQAKKAKMRRYAAHAVMIFARKVKDKRALLPLVKLLVAAHSHDPDERVRQSAGMALARGFGWRAAPK